MRPQRDRLAAAAIEGTGRGFEKGAVMRRFASAGSWAIIAVMGVAMSPLGALAITPDNPGTANVRFTIDSAATKPISPYIYGINFYNPQTYNTPAMLDRLGGNRWTGYNWETNASNAGRDWYYQNDTHMGSGNPGQAVEGSLDAASAANRGIVVTVPMSGYVAGDTAGPVQYAETQSKARFKEIVPQKESVYPGSSLSLAPNETDEYVFTDEYVNWVEQNKGDADVFYSLDNEPGLWGEALPSNWQPGVPTSVQPSPQGRTHGALHPYAPTFQELRDKTIDTAKAIKSVNPDAKVFGGVGYGWNDFVSLQDAPDRSTHFPRAVPGGPEVDPDGNETGEMSFHEYLLSEVKKEEDVHGPLMDVLDLHWYPEARSGPNWDQGTRIADDNSTNPSTAIIQARVQAPRSLWDPTYTGEKSWITQWSTQGPIKLLPRVQEDIDHFKPGTKIAITEYNYGGTRHISGGIAQADVLGIFGREGVFAASLWDLYGASNSRFAQGAFKMYLDYDGANGDGKFGDLSIDAATTSNVESAVYASLDSSDPSSMVLVAINRTNQVRSAAIEVTHDLRFDVAEVYQLTSASSSPVRAADIPIDLVNAFIYQMPAFSVSTLVLRAPEAGDFNGDGAVNESDLNEWALGFGAVSDATFAMGDNDGDGDVDGTDFLGWQRAAGSQGELTTVAVAEPATFGLFASAAVAAAVLSRGAFSFRP